MHHGSLQRSAGILLHPTSLPGPYGVGDLGPAAYRWIDQLARAGQTWWQLLPLGPTGAGDSPYQSFSAFAGNLFLLSPDALAADGLLSAGDLAEAALPFGPVDYGAVRRVKTGLLRRAWQTYQGGSAFPELRSAFDEFQEREAGWLDELGLFLALKEEQGDCSWLDWPDDLRLRRPAALDAAKVRLQGAIGRQRFGQFLFDRQWRALKKYAAQRRVQIIGDVPIFIAGDSADVWANPDLFQLDSQRRPRVVAGVPPDYFSPTGQLWGNPLYDWAALKATGYAWWVARLRAAFQQVDLVRLDHFRGFTAYWEIPAGSPTAETGRWIAGSGADLFEKFASVFGELPLIAEDLGVITPDVEALRQRFRLPGMRILLFTFGSFAEERFLPHEFTRPTVVYTGTHDNDTAVGWYNMLDEASRREFRRYFPPIEDNVAWDLIRAAWASVADVAVAPLQDLLALGTLARMNYPGRPEGNWRWRYAEGTLTEKALDRLAEWTEVYGRNKPLRQSANPEATP